MDPFSVASGIAGLISLAEVVVRNIYKYTKGVREASSDITRLIEETSTLYGLLQRLKLAVDVMDANSQFQTIPLPYISSCQKTLEKIKSELGKYQSASSYLKWPFKSSQTQALIQEIERRKTTLSLALQENEVIAIFKNLGMTDNIKQEIGEIKKLLEAKAKIYLTKENIKVLDDFSKLTPLESYETSLRLRHAGTCQWLQEMEEFKVWMKTPNSGLWIYGIPGAGKTVLAGVTIEHALSQTTLPYSEDAVAYFFCDYKTAITQDPINIIASLARQLAKQHEECFDIIKKYHAARISSRGQWSLPTVEDMCDCVLRMSQFFENVMLIIDGVDECGDAESQTAQMMANLLEGSSKIKILVLSRDEQGIREQLDSFEKISIAARSSDIRLYIAAEIENRTISKQLRIKNSNIKQEIMDTLIDQAQGMFRWVACQMDYLCELSTDASRRKALKSLPPTLYGSYERILERINKKPRSSQIIAQRALKWIFAWPGYELPLKALCEAVSVEEDSTEQDKDAIPSESDLLGLCSSFVRLSSSGNYVEFAHFSVQEFLEKLDVKKRPEFALYQLNLDEDEIAITKTLIRYLSFEDFNCHTIIKYEDARYPLKKAIFDYCPNFLRESWDPSLINDIRTLFNNQRPPAFVSFVHHYFSTESAKLRLSKEMESWCMQAINSIYPLHMAAYLGNVDICLYLLKDKFNPNHISGFGTPLHITVLQYRILNEVMDCFDHIPKLLPNHHQVAVALLDAGADPNTSWCTESHTRTQKEHKSYTVTDLCINFAQDLLPDICCAGARFNTAQLERLLQSFTDVPKESFKELVTLLKPVLHTIEERELDDSGKIIFKKMQLISGSLKNDDWFGDNGDMEHEKDMLLLAVKQGQGEIIRRLLFNPVLLVELNAIRDRLGNPLLLIAAEHNHTDAVGILLEKGIDLNQINNDGETALHISALRRATECLTKLLAAGGNMNKKNKLGWTAWHLAAYNGTPELLRLLATYPGGTEALANCLSDDGCTPAHFAARGGNIEVIEYLLDLSGNADICNLNGGNLFHALVMGRFDMLYPMRPYTNDIDIARMLLARGYSCSMADKQGRTVFSYLLARESLDWDFVKLIMKRTPPDIIATTYDHLQRTLLSVAATQGDLEACQWLMGNIADVNSHDKNGETALLLASRGGYLDVIKALLEKGADVTAKNSNGENALLIGATKGDPLVVQELLARGCSIEARSNIGITPLLAASWNGHENVVKTLIDSGADITATDLEGMNAAHMACLRDSVRVLGALELTDINWTGKMYHISTDDNISLCHWAACANSTKCLEYLLGFRPIDEILALTGKKRSLLHAVAVTGNVNLALRFLELGCDINGVDTAGSTALFHAAEKGQTDMVRMLFGHGANANLATVDGVNPWEIALRNEHAAVIKLLEAHNRSQDLSTPNKLHIQLKKAITTRDIEWCRRLVNKGVDLNSSFLGNCTCSPISVALVEGNPEIHNFLLDNDACARGNVCQAHRPGGWPVLHQCAFLGSLDLFKKILSKNSGLARMSFPIHPLHVAVANNRLEMAKALISGDDGVIQPCDINVAARQHWFLGNGFCCDEGGTALHIACSLNNAAAVRLLLKHHARVNDITEEANSPLHIAAGQRSEEIIQLLVANGADVNARDHMLETPLMRAARNQHNVHCLSLLIGSGAHETLRDFGGRQAVHHAARSGNSPALAFLWSRGANLEALTNSGKAAFFSGLASENKATATFLLNCGADLSYCALTNGNVIHNILLLHDSMYKVRLLRKLLKRLGRHNTHQMVNHDSLRYGTPLHLATASNAVSCILILLSAGADIDAESLNDGTALMRAARGGRIEAARVLVDAGASIVIWKEHSVLSAVQAARNCPTILRWFLVTRFTERRWLAM